MTRAAHSWVSLHNTYVENNLIQPGRIHLKGEALDLGQINLDVLRGRRGEGSSYRPLGRRLAPHAAGPAARSVSFWHPAATLPGSSIPPAARWSYWVNDGTGRPTPPEQWREFEHAP